MDDNYRLVKLISLVAWTHPAENKCGLRFLSNADRDRLSRDEGTAGRVMSQRYAGAARYHQGKAGPGDELDRRQLPERTLEFVSNLSSPSMAAALLDQAQLGRTRTKDQSDRAGWIQYYGAFYRSALCPLLARINAYLMRWIRKKYKRLRPLPQGPGLLATHHPPVPQVTRMTGAG